MTLRRFFPLLLGAVLAAAPAWLATPASADDIVRAVRQLRIGDTVPQTHFIDQSGHPFTFADFRGRGVVLAFIYTRCRDPRECPLVSSTFHSLQQRIDGKAYHLVEITFDPAFDRPPVLARYAQQFDADSRLWTLPPRSIVVGVVCGLTNALGAWALYTALERGARASIAVPLTALNPLVTLVLALVLLGERLTAVQTSGVILAIAAGVLLSYEPDTPRPDGH